MKLFLKFTFLLLPCVFLMSYCTIEEVDDEEDGSEQISNQPAQGSTNENEAFELGSALVENRTLFSDEGYYFHLYRENKDCDSGQLNGDIRFFIETTEALEEKEYDGQGPFITNTSFFGCTVIITSVSDTEISGKVKGGDDPDTGDKWVEGSFTATLCE
ncbi:MAG: hypothetical protein AB8F74_11710 [Saprospiraceae bacterium]